MGLSVQALVKGGACSRVLGRSPGDSKEFFVEPCEGFACCCLQGFCELLVHFCFYEASQGLQFLCNATGTAWSLEGKSDLHSDRYAWLGCAEALNPTPISIKYPRNPNVGVCIIRDI